MYVRPLVDKAGKILSFVDVEDEDKGGFDILNNDLYRDKLIDWM